MSDISFFFYFVNGGSMSSSISTRLLKLFANLVGSCVSFFLSVWMLFYLFLFFSWLRSLITIWSWTVWILFFVWVSSLLSSSRLSLRLRWSWSKPRDRLGCSRRLRRLGWSRRVQNWSGWLGRGLRVLRCLKWGLGGLRKKIF